MKIKKSDFFIFSLFFSLLCPLKAAFAYVDPGTGSYILQIVIAGLFGLLFSLKLFWRKILVFLKKLFGKNKE